MSDVTTAMVETLTAEVKTLTIGRRQVTLSVYRQLDYIRYEEIEPFGRVNDSCDLKPDPYLGIPPNPYTVFVVGRRRDTGTLARSATEMANIEQMRAMTIALPLIILAGMQ
jgi:hypothetical protein